MELKKAIVETVRTLYEKYWDGEQKLLREYYPVDPDKLTYSYLWGYGAWLTALCAVRELFADDAFDLYLSEVFGRLEAYRAARNDFTVYNSAPDVCGYGEPFYDDNAWVALGCLEMFRITGDASYRQRAENIADYLFHGWSDTVGGIRWKEHDCNSSNTCSSAPTAAVAAILYEATGQSEYLDWAKRIYAWVRTELMDENGIYFDSLDDDRKVCSLQFSYNTGVMIINGVRLYEATGEKVYLDDALRSGRAAETFFLRESAVAGRKMLPEMPWFNVYLLRGWLALERYRDSGDLCDTVLACAQYAYENTRTADGLWQKDWTAKPTKEPYCSLNLDTLGSLECLAVTALWQTLRKEKYVCEK